MTSFFGIAQSWNVYQNRQVIRESWNVVDAHMDTVDRGIVLDYVIEKMRLIR
jgi:hypothetical protein